MRTLFLAGRRPPSGVASRGRDGGGGSGDFSSVVGPQPLTPSHRGCGLGFNIQVEGERDLQSQNTPYAKKVDQVHLWGPQSKQGAIWRGTEKTQRSLSPFFRWGQWQSKKKSPPLPKDKYIRSLKLMITFFRQGVFANVTGTKLRMRSPWIIWMGPRCSDSET